MSPASDCHSNRGVGGEGVCTFYKKTREEIIYIFNLHMFNLRSQNHPGRKDRCSNTKLAATVREVALTQFYCNRFTDIII